MISSGPSAQRAWRRHAWLVPIAGGAGAVGLLCWGAWRYGYDPHWLDHGHAWYRGVLRPGQNLTLVVTVALWLAGLAGYWWPRRRQQQQLVGLTVAVTMVVMAAVLGEASYIPCRGQMSIVGVTFWIIQLYVGQPPNIYQAVYPATTPPYACAGPPPLALQLGQFDGLGAILLVGALTAAALLWRQPLERLRSRFSREVILFTGLDALTLPLLNRLALPPSRYRIVVIEPDETHALLDEARTAGARVLIGDPSSTRLLEPIISTWRGCALRYLYAMRGEVAENDAVLNSASDILCRHPPPVGHLPHLIARVDDPRHASSWRGSRVGIPGLGLEDALSPAETTAHALVESILQTRARELIICGDSSLTIAILAELDRRGCERRELSEASARGRQASPDAPAFGDLPPALPIKRITLIDPRSAETRREYQVGVPEAIAAAGPPIGIRERPWQDDLVGILDSLSPTGEPGA